MKNDVINLKMLILMSAAVMALYLVSMQNFLLFHTLSETFAIMTAFAVFIMTWSSIDFLKSSFFKIIGIAMFFVAGLDFMHTISYKGIGIIPDLDTNVPTQLWIAGRYLQVIGFGVAFLFYKKRVSPVLVFIYFSILTSLMLFTIFTGVFPVCYVEGEGLTPFKIFSEYLVISIYAFYIYLILKNDLNIESKVRNAIAFALFFSILSELAFTFYISVYGISNLVGHLFKILAFFVIYKFIVEVGFKSPLSFMTEDLKSKSRNLIVLNAELKQSKNILQAQYDQMIAIMDSLHAGVFICDIDTKNVLFINKYGLDIVGVDKYSNSNYCYKTLHGMAESCSGCVAENINNFDDLTEKAVGYEVKFKNSERYYYSIDRIIKWKDNKDVFLKILFDISDMKKIDELTKDFQRISTHDLGNVLFAIMMGMEILEDAFEEGSENREILNAIILSCKKADEIIQISNLMFSIESNRYDLETNEVNLYEVIEHANNVYKTVVKNKRLNIIMKGIAKDKAFFVQSDAKLLGSLIANLFSNAVEAAPEGGSIEYDVFRDQGWCVISIMNDGEVPFDIRDYFFDKYVTSGKENGTGLGTYAAKIFTEMHGGEISLDSSISGKTKIVVKLPNSTTAPVSTF